MILLTLLYLIQNLGVLVSWCPWCPSIQRMREHHDDSANIALSIQNVGVLVSLVSLVSWYVNQQRRSRLYSNSENIIEFSRIQESTLKILPRNLAKIKDFSSIQESCIEIQPKSKNLLEYKTVVQKSSEKKRREAWPAGPAEPDKEQISS